MWLSNFPCVIIGSSGTTFVKSISAALTLKNNATKNITLKNNFTNRELLRFENFIKFKLNTNCGCGTF